MKVGDRPMRSIWLAEDGRAVEIIDQTRLPHDLVTRRLETLEDAAHAIRAMLVRGAPLIGATAAYGLALALRADPSDAGLEAAAETLLATRPTAAAGDRDPQGRAALETALRRLFRIDAEKEDDR